LVVFTTLLHRRAVGSMSASFSLKERVSLDDSTRYFRGTFFLGTCPVGREKLKRYVNVVDRGGALALGTATGKAPTRAFKFL